MDKTAAVGKVWLAGAGPGDAGLLTVKTRDLIEAVDVIVYDALVSIEVLSQIPHTCELIYVGKRSGHHPIPQAEINEILLKEAQQGKKVLRLKGGDPFVFGRGGEELELLVSAGIPFEIVPGITSAVAVPAYAGIPVTHRDHTSSFHIITGHARRAGNCRINYQSLVKMDATLVFLMGVAAMQEISKGLLDAGMDPEVPVAILEKGTTAKQRRVISTISHITEDAKREEIKAPAIILVGKVALLSEAFSWAEQRKLGGRQFLVTRPRKKGSALATQLRKLGAQVIELPSIVTKSITPNKELAERLTEFAKKSEEAWLVFTSPAGVECFFEQLQKLAFDLRSLLSRKAEIMVAAVGSATARELKKHGLIPDLIPDVYCGKELGKMLAARAKEHSEVLLLRAKEGTEEILPVLEEAGLAVSDIAVYETLYEGHQEIKDKIKELYEKGEIDAVTFTSASTVEGFVKTIESTDYRQVKAICIGEQTAAAARRYQMDIQVSKSATIDSMIDTLIDLYHQ